MKKLSALDRLVDELLFAVRPYVDAWGHLDNDRAAPAVERALCAHLRDNSTIKTMVSAPFDRPIFLRFRAPGAYPGIIARWDRGPDSLHPSLPWSSEGIERYPEGMFDGWDDLPFEWGKSR